MRHALISFTVIAMVASSRLNAQDMPFDELETDGLEVVSTSQDLTFRPGQTAASAVGRAGERREKEQVEGLEPLARINSRIKNRVEARIRNRIDRHYDPQANAKSPFAITSDEVDPLEPKRRLPASGLQ